MIDDQRVWDSQEVTVKIQQETQSSSSSNINIMGILQLKTINRSTVACGNRGKINTAITTWMLTNYSHN